MTDAVTATLKSVDSALVETELPCTVTVEGGSSLKVTLTSPSVLAVTTNYTLEVKNVATPQDDDVQYGHVRISAGASTVGSKSWSVAAWADELDDNSFSYGDLDELDFTSRDVTVIRGTYSGALCVESVDGAFNQDVSVSYAGSDFTLVPATLDGVLG